MAKLKVKGEKDLVTVSDERAKLFREQSDAGLLKPNDFFNFGNRSIRPRDVVDILADDVQIKDSHADAMKKHWEEYNALVRLPIDQKVMKQEKLFNLWCHIMGVKKDFNEFKPMIKDFLVAHPKRAWMKFWDIAKEWNVNKSFDIATDRTLMMLAKLEENELKQETFVKQTEYEQSLKSL